MAPERNTEEYAPLIIPIISGRENSLIEDTPSTYIIPMVNSVVRDVLIERANVWFTLLLIISAVSFLRNLLLFSLIRSKMTIVELIEYPRMSTMPQ